MMYFFFFKQKTAYEMRISDWSSDVCSSDLLLAGERDAALEELARLRGWADQRGAGRLLIEVNILAAAGLRGQGAIEESRSCFDEAVGIAMFQNVVRPFVEARQFAQPSLDDAMRAAMQVHRFRPPYPKPPAKPKRKK